jgi:hypothetical protein
MARSAALPTTVIPIYLHWTVGRGCPLALLLTCVFYAVRDGDKALRAHRLARRHPPCHRLPERMFCAYGPTYAHRFSRYS